MEFYHVLNRGVEKRNIVLDDGDRMRFVRSLFVLNDVHPAPNGKSQQSQWEDLTRRREVLVDIHAWCIMDNHYHLLLSPKNDAPENISKFMKKLNMGYAKFFNEKHTRSGYLWQGKYKKIHIDQDAHLLYLPYYIHLNPLDYTHPEWRNGTVDAVESALETLYTYRWSSLSDYMGRRNFPSIINPTFLTGTLGSQESQIAQMRSILSGNNTTHRDASNIFES